MESTIKEIKQRFFAMRNGMLADQLRKISDYEIIFGLQIPQLAEIACELKPSMALADRLWSERHVRESRLLSTYLYPVSEVTIEKAIELAQQSRGQEEADMLSFRLFKRLPYAVTLMARLAEEPDIDPYLLRTLANHLS